MHRGQEVCEDNFQAERGPENRYRTTPLRGLWSHAKGGFYHDGRFPTLDAVVNHYNSCFSLNLTAAEKNDLVQFLKSI
jgi:cytochrome c peroxidase